ncbi:MAG TPA: hypothetical protein VKE94_13015 [Gemmataceae bacterium]|nr:hypothetical protein [Gemmataceae bacterium]
MTPEPEARWDVETVVLQSLLNTARGKRPRAAIAAYETMIALGAFGLARQGPFRHINQLALKCRPAVAAAAVRALRRARRAEKRIPR